MAKSYSAPAQKGDHGMKIDTGGAYSCPSTGAPPKSYRSSAPTGQMPPTEGTYIPQRKQLAGTK